jgi:hypothetical protein
MKTTLKISILFNLGLLGCMIFAVVAAVEGRKVTSKSMPPVMAETGPPVTEIAAPALQASPQAEPQPQPFRWSQLESADYRTYVKNLRGIGCPEPTLRAIVTADVDRVYTVKNDQLEQKLTALQNGSWSERLATFDTQQTLEAEIQKLPGEEDLEITELLDENTALAATSPSSSPQKNDQSNAVAGASITTSLAVVGTTGTTVTMPLAAAGTTVTMPLAMQPLNLTALDLNSDEIKAINDLRQSFIQKVGGANQDPNDPAYLARWQAAQPEADGVLEWIIGNEAWQELQLQAYASAQANATANP